MLKRSLLLGLVVIAGLHCESTDTRYVKDGVDYGATEGVFRGRWWSYFERGTNLLGGEFYEAAAADFREALKGRATDTWRARTYGLHFTQYFPNRELGVALYHLGQLNEAEAALQKSLADVDTARAHHYLDLVKKEKIAQGLIRDETAPGIDVGLGERALVASLDVPLTIAATDDSGVETMRVNGNPLYQRGSRADITYKPVLTFDEGVHQVTIEASDLADKMTTVTREIVVDLTGPTVGIREPADALVTEAASIRLAGSTVDDFGVVSVTLDGRTIAQAGSESGETRLAFEAELALRDGENTFVVSARDAAGNETYTAINVYRGRRSSTAARLWLLREKYPDLLKVAAASPSPSSLVLVLEALEAQEAQPATGPQISIKSPKEEQPWRNNRAVRVVGEVLANTKLAMLMINDQPVQQLTGEPKESFNKRIPLRPEDFNPDGTAKVDVKVVAQNQEGVEAQQQVAVQVQPVDIETPESRMKMAVLTFGGTAADDLRGNMRTFAEASIGASNRFTLLERAELARILQEQQLSDELGDREAALRLGKVIPAHVFILADVAQVGTEAEIFVRVVNTENTQIMTQVDTHIADAGSTAALRAATDAVTEQLKEKFPRISGEVLSTRGTTLLLNWTKEDGLMPGVRMLVVKQEEPFKDPNTGEVLMEGETTIVGQALITRVLDSGVLAEPIQPEGGGAIQIDQGMPTITM